MWYQNIRSALFSFVTIHASDGRTDRQTDRQKCDNNTVRCITCSRTVKNLTCVTHQRFWVRQRNDSFASCATNISVRCESQSATTKSFVSTRWSALQLVNKTTGQLFILTLSPPIPLRPYAVPYWSNPPFLISDIRALWRSVLSARAPKCQKLKTVG